MKKFANFICKNKVFILIVTGILLIPALIGMKATKINYDILVYLPEDIETVRGQNILTDDFDMGAFSVSIIDNMNARDISKLENKIREVEGVNKVITAYDVIGNTIPLDVIPSDLRSKVSNGESDIMLVTFDDSTSSEITLNAVKEVRRLTDNSSKIGGMSAMVLDTMELSEREIAVYIVIAVILCLIVLELALDSYLVPFLLLLNIGIAILFNLGTNVFLGNISYITKALVAVLQLGVTTDFSIFLYHSYENKKKEFKDRADAMTAAIEETFSSVVGSSLTTIAGFLVLCAMQLTLGSDLGIVMAKGVILGVICVLTVFPSMILVFDKYIEKTKHKTIVPKFEKLSKILVKYNKVALLLFLILFVPMYIANTKTDIYYKLDETLPKDLDSIVANADLKEKFNIVSPEIVIIDKDIKPNDIIKITDEIESLDGVDFALSLSSLNKDGISIDLLDSKFMDNFESDKYQLILVNSTYEVASDELNRQVSDIQKIVKKYDGNAILAGEGPLMKDLVTISNEDFNSVNTWSISCILVIMIFVLKSLSLPIILIIAIENAIFINMGIPYFTGTSLPFVASIVLGTVQLGATIDYAILLTNTYLTNRKKGIEKTVAMEETLKHCISAILISGMCFFAATFGVGIYSDLEMISSLCTLISRGAIISMLVVITVLPSLLLTLDKIITKTTLGFKKESKKMNKRLEKLAAIVMCGVLLTSSMPVYALSKEETVYSHFDTNGDILKTEVSEYLWNSSKSEKINDLSSLESILNVNGYEDFSKDGNKIIWNAKGNDIFYRGTTNKTLPVDMDVKYYFDGKESKLEDILGQKGTFKIKIKFKNTDAHKLNINGKKETLYTPFVVTTGMIIPGENKVTVDKGKVINSGNKNIAVGITLPGLYESIGYGEKMDEINIKITSDNFELPTIYSFIIPKVLESSDLKVFDELDQVIAKTSDVKEKAKELGTGVSKLNDGAKKVNSGATEIYNSVLASLDSISELASGAKGVDEGVDKIISKVSASAKSLDDPSAMEKLAAMKLLIQKNAETIEAIKDVNPEMALLLQKNNEALSESLKTMSDIKNSTEKSTSELVSGLESLKKGTSLISNGTAKLNQKMQALSGGLGELSAGTKQVSKGMNELSSSVEVLSENALNKLDTYVNKIKTFESKTKALVKLGEQYNTFAMKDANMDGNTKFLYILDGAKKEEEKTQKEEVKSESNFFTRVKDLFK